MKILQKVQCALVPLVMVCNTGHTTSFKEKILTIDDTKLATAIQTAIDSSNKKLEAEGKALQALKTNYTHEAAYDFYELLCKGKPASHNEITMAALNKMKATDLKTLIEQDKDVMAAGVTVEHDLPYDAKATTPKGIRDTGGNLTTKYTYKDPKKGIKGTEKQVDHANTEKGFEYIQNEISITSDATITKELLKELKKDKMEITDTTMGELEKEIAELTLKKSKALRDIVATKAHTAKPSELLTALSEKDAKIDPNETAEANLERILGKKEYEKLKGVKRDTATKERVNKMIQRFNKLTGENKKEANETIFITEEEAKQAKELHDDTDIEKMLAAGEKNEADMKKEQEEKAKLQDKLNEANAEKAKLEKQIQTYKDEETARAELLEESKDQIKGIYGIKVDDITTLETLIRRVRMADIDTLAELAGYKVPDPDENNKLNARIKELEDENAKLQKQILNKGGSGAEGITLEDKQFIKWMRNQMDAKAQQVANERWDWLKDKTILAIKQPKKGA